MRIRKSFGYQLMLDLYGCKSSVCDDMNLCYDFLSELVGFIGMHKQSEPVVVRTDHRRFPDKKGLSGWVALVESGIQIHTLSLKNFITIDVYSCRRFDRRKVIKFTKRYFNPEEIDDQFVLRGRKYFGV